MSAVLREQMDAVPSRRLRHMTVADLDAVADLEAAAYAFPWSRGNFVDSLSAGYPSQVLLGADGRLLGYFVAMLGVDEMHLLNVSVAPSEQGRGHARFMLDALVVLCRSLQAGQLWLEVRESNDRACRLYLRYGFRHIGIRRGYYPAAQGKRENAAVMSLALNLAQDPAQRGKQDAVD